MNTMVKERHDKPEPVRVDDRGRIILPKHFREQMGVNAGDTLFVRYSPKLRGLEMLKAINPFDMLAEKALQDYRAGKTISIDDLADKLGIDLNSSE